MLLSRIYLGVHSVLVSIVNLFCYDLTLLLYFILCLGHSCRKSHLTRHIPFGSVRHKPRRILHVQFLVHTFLNHPAGHLHAVHLPCGPKQVEQG